VTSKKTKFKRITVSVDVSIPDEWTIRQTEKWVEERLGPGAQCNEQRLAKEGGTTR
jgi:hypothetical protein